MSHIHVRSAAEAEGLSKALETASRFALDCEETSILDATGCNHVTPRQKSFC